MKPATATYELTAMAREHYARDLFDPARVAKLVERRATEGYRDLRLVQSHLFDLSRSSAARKLETWLDRHQYRYGWYPTPPSLDPLCSASSEDYPELVIFW